MAVGTGGALHPAAGSTGQRSEGVGTDESGCRGWEEGEQEPEEESGGGGGAEAGGLAAPFVGDGGGLRSAVQPQSGRGQPSEQERKEGNWKGLDFCGVCEGAELG